MEFTQYQWEMYLKAGGQKVVDQFQRAIDGERDGVGQLIGDCLVGFCPDKGHVKQCLMDIDSVVESLKEESFQPEYQILDDQGGLISDEEVPCVFLKEWMNDFLESHGQQSQGVEAMYYFCSDFFLYSTFWAFEAPNHCIPYYFSGCYHVLCRMAEIFGIELPDIPGKTQYVERMIFYCKLCNVFHAFRVKNGWSAAELWAFLYDYGPKSAGGLTWLWNDLPDPRKAYVFGRPADTISEEQSDHEIFYFQGNEDMQPGDIGVMYRWNPASCFSSVWRAVSPGFYDPLYFHYRCVYYGHSIEIPKITYKMLKEDPVFSQTSLVKTKMLRMDGAPLKNSEYMHLLDMSAKQGKVSGDVPKLELRTEIHVGHIKMERDVETQLLEPLLERLGWKPGDWQRQMSIRIGSGVNKYPDYVVKPDYGKLQESGELVLEAKLSISNNKQLEKDRVQAQSYAILLKAKAYVLVSKEGIWISEKTDGFKAITGYTWAQLEEEDIFNQVNVIIGNVKYINSQKRK